MTAVKGRLFWNEAREAELIRLHGRCAMQDIANALGCTLGAVEARVKWLRRCGIMTPSGSPDATAWRRGRTRIARAVNHHAVITAYWPDPTVSVQEISLKTGLSRETICNYAWKEKLGPKGGGRIWSVTDLVSRPNKPSGDGGRYNGRRYEDDPRDPKPRSHVIMTGLSRHGSLVGCAAEMCAT